MSSLLAVVKLLLEKPNLVKIKNRDELLSTAHSRGSKIFEHFPQESTLKRIKLSKSGMKFQGIEEEEEGTDWKPAKKIK